MSSKISKHNTCCLFGFYMRNISKSTTQLAELLGVTTRTVRRHKNNIRGGSCSCGGTGICVYLTSSVKKPESVSVAVRDSSEDSSGNAEST